MKSKSANGGLWLAPTIISNEPFRYLLLFACLLASPSARAQTFLTGTEGFESGLDGWTTDNSAVWQVGKPTKSGGAPTDAQGAQAHSGTNCAVTVLTGNYPVGANSRFISPAITVPAANQYPRLRFWQYYSFFSGDCGADYGVVEVRVGTGAWKAVSPQYVNNAGSWSEPSIDLMAYAGQTIQVAFHIVYVNCDNATAAGWYVDDVALVTGQPVFNNPEGFESGVGDWYADDGVWQAGKPSKSGGAPTDAQGAQAQTAPTAR